jgi:UDP-glucose 4-epimerase
LKKAIVTGAGGFIGQALVQRLVADGVPVIGVHRTLPPQNSNVGSARQVDADLREPDAIAGLVDSDTVVFHFAGHTSVAGSVRDPMQDFENNVAATVEVMETVRRVGAIMILPSSPAVFGQQSELPIRETATRNPVSPYGAAKLACEGYARAFHACYGMDVRIARIFNVYGPGMRKFAIFDFWNKLRSNPHHLEILGMGDQIRDYLYIDDCVDALLQIARYGSVGGDYNVGSGQPTETIQLARTMAQLMGCPSIEISVKGESFPGDIARWYADISRLQAIGFAAQIPLCEGLAQTIAWLDEQHQRMKLRNLAHGS